ncbi:hypothetical protein [Leucobacter chromiireducens]|uniref:hypothetical protein n=1 Tax=Leucobacter chromiireducens TaxID=283877 RepID=UPI001927910B|nr:hypothetical protein [Leucobacter chromiireducens]
MISVAAVSGLVLGGSAGVMLGTTAQSSAGHETAKSDSSQETDATPTTGPVEEEQTPSPAVSKRGNLIKRVGERGGIGDSEPLEVEFLVTGITVDPECTGEYPQPSKNGHFVKLDFEVATSSEAQGEFGFAFWKWIRPDGTTANADPGQDGNGYMCLAAGEQLPHYIGPGESVTGSVVLDVADPEGTLVAQPAYAGSTGSWTWEWAVPAG